MDQQPASKHTLYFELRSALEQEACPICRLGLRAVERHFDALTYEGVNDPVARAELRAARGFCYPHAWQFAIEVHDGLGTALIYRDILIHVLRPANRLTTATPAQPLQGQRVRRPAPLGPSTACPACRTLERAAHRYLDTLLIHLPEAEMRAAYLAGPGLCRPHLRAALSLVGRPPDLELLREDGLRRFAAQAAGSAGKTWAREATARLWGEPRGTTRGEHAVWGAGLAGLEEARPEDVRVCALCAAPGAEIASAGMLDLCNAHAWRLVPTVPRDQAVAALTSGLQAASAVLQSDQGLDELRPQSWWRRLGRRGLPQGRLMASRLLPACACPACEQTRALAAQRLPAVIEGALCLPHLLLALEAVPTPREAVAALQPSLSYWRSLRAELDEYIRKQDYRFRHEPMGAETDAPWRAVAAMAGERGS